MPAFNLTIDDASPLISYTGTWGDTNTADASWTAYANQTFHATQSANASASLTFNGTGIYLYGAKRFNHGAYTVTIGQNPAVTMNGSASPDVFEQLLYGNGSLPYGQHTVTLANAGAPGYVDLDYVVITTGDNDASTVSQDTVLDDASPAFVYDNLWTVGGGDLIQTYENQTMHVTDGLNAAAEIHFTGNAISLYGATSSNHGSFSVSLDGAAPVILNGTAPTFRPQTLLYRWDRLADTDHVVSVQNLATDANVYLDLDYAVVTRYGSAASLSSTTSSSASGTALPLASSATATSTAAANTTITTSTRSSPLVGALAGVLVFLLALSAGLWVILRRLRERRRRRAGVQVVEIRESRIGGGDLSFLSPNQLIVNPFSNPSPRSAEFEPFGYGVGAPPAYGKDEGSRWLAAAPPGRYGPAYPEKAALSRTPSSAASSSSFSHD